MSEADAFEAALRDNPDDLAGWCAYADYLVERGDPRGEFMQVQIALEDESRSYLDRKTHKQRELTLLAMHKREWLGVLAPHVLDTEPIYGDERRIDAKFRRGWLTELLCRSLSVNEARALARAPEARMLSRLLVQATAYENPGSEPRRGQDSCYEPGSDVPDTVDEYNGPALYALRHVPHLASVRVFRYGDGPTAIDDGDERYGPCHANGTVVHEVVARMARLEELYLYAFDVDAELFSLALPCLRVLRVEHEMSYPLERLAANPSLGRLTHLLCHPHAQRPDDPDAYIRINQLQAVCASPHLTSLEHLQLRLTDFGDEGAEVIVASGILKRLRVLDISYGCMTDDGAQLLAACPDLRNLRHLDLSQNALTELGIDALRKTGISLNIADQHGEHPSRMEPNGYLEYLSYGDME